MKTLLFALLTMPLLSGAAAASTVYTFTAHTIQGPIGFTFVSPQPLTQPSTYVSSWMLAGCETTGAPGWICLDAYLRQTTINGMPIVQVVMDIAYPPGLGDGFATDQLTESFPGASLDSAGNYAGFLSEATLAVIQSGSSSDGDDSPEVRGPKYRSSGRASTASNRTTTSEEARN